jgi:undecaprenyl-diphosphatase
MNYIQAIILGIVEGLTEFLPISSTGHIIITSKILTSLGFTQLPNNTFFDIVIQLGAISAALWYFRNRIYLIVLDLVMLATSPTKFSSASSQQKLSLWILIGIIPTLIIGFVFKKNVDSWQENLWLVAISTIIFGVVFYLIEQYSQKQKSIDTKHISLSNLVVMGLAQSLAIIPGVSRSGATIAGGLSQKISFKDSIEISFIMGIPVIFLAAGYKALSNLGGLTTESILLALVGTVTSFAVGLFAIRATLGLLTKHGFFPFMIYRITLGLAIISLLSLKIL